MRQTLPPTLAWPAKPAIVIAALGDIATHVSVAFMSWERSKPSDCPIHASWSPQARHSTLPAQEPAQLWIAPVAREGIADMRKIMREELLPAARTWLAAALASSEVWQLARHERRWFVSVSGAVSFGDDDGMHILDRERGTRGRYRAPIR